MHAGFEGTIGDHDKVCYRCYKLHLHTLQEEPAISEDSDLQDLITRLLNSLPGSVQTVVESSLSSVAIVVAEEFLNGNAKMLRIHSVVWPLH